MAVGDFNTLEVGRSGDKHSDTVTSKGYIDPEVDTGRKAKGKYSTKRILLSATLIYLGIAFCVALGILIWKFVPGPGKGPCSLNPCTNSGECYERGENFICVCQSELKAEFCQEQDESPCFPNPCLNSGDCYARGENFTCDCPSQFKGELCEHTGKGPCSPDPCMNSGECFERGENFMCVCQSEFKGEVCLEKADASPCFPNPCLNSGDCYARGENFTCVCPSQFKGVHCEQTDSWLSPVDGCIRSHNDFVVILGNSSMAACVSLCEQTKEFLCCSIEFVPETGKCHLATATPETVPQGYYTLPCYSGEHVMFTERQGYGCPPRGV